MNISDIPTTTLAAAPIDERLHELAAALLSRGFGVYVYRRHNAVGGYIPSTWLAIERDGHLGTVQVESLVGGYTFSFEIKPSRETGSGLRVVLDEGKPSERDEVTELEDLITAAHIATQSHYQNFATTRPLPNFGWDSFTWAMRSLVKVTEA